MKTSTRFTLSEARQRRVEGLIVLLPFALAALAGCGGSNGGAASAPDHSSDAPAVAEARATFPRFLDLQVGLISSTCSPNPGVCHNSSNYPDLSTAGGTLSAVGGPCNMEIPDPLQGWDGCERPADRLVAGAVDVRMAWLERVTNGTWRIGIEGAAASTGTVPVSLASSDGSTILEEEWAMTATLEAGSSEITLIAGAGDDFVADFLDGVVRGLSGGDPNRNGVWGGDDETMRGALLTPGNLDKSYLWGRITATVPGSRMPLANGPITPVEYIAIACWIEGLDGSPQAEDRIDYDACSFAEAPSNWESL